MRPHSLPPPRPPRLHQTRQGTSFHACLLTCSHLHPLSQSLTPPFAPLRCPLRTYLPIYPSRPTAMETPASPSKSPPNTSTSHNSSKSPTSATAPSPTNAPS